MFSKQGERGVVFMSLLYGLISRWIRAQLRFVSVLFGACMFAPRPPIVIHLFIRVKVQT